MGSLIILTREVVTFSINNVHKDCIVSHGGYKQTEINHSLVIAATRFISLFIYLHV